MRKSKIKVVLGVDPGLAITGYGVITCQGSRLTMRECGAIKSGPREIFGQRLDRIYGGLNKIIKKYQPDEIAVEKLFFAKNSKTALKVGEGRGVAMLAAWQHGVPIKEFTPLQVKLALTGYGLAPKNQVEKMVKLQLRLKSIPQPDDIADALAVAICSSQTKFF